MSRKVTQSTQERNFDTQFSSGDSNKMVPKPKQLYTEENNNEIDDLSKEFTAMGCIVDALKRPANVGVESCVYQSLSDHEEQTKDDHEGAYSDAFDDLSDDDQPFDDLSDDNQPAKRDPMTKEKQLRAVQSEENGMRSSSITPGQSNLKSSKSQSYVSSKRRTSTSSKYGSVSVPKSQRINMSFNNERLREIERHNHILLEKIMSARNTRKSSIPPRPAPESQRPRRLSGACQLGPQGSRQQGSLQPGPSQLGSQPRPAPAAMQRKTQQRQIDRDNMFLLRRIQQAKSSSCSLRR